MVLDCCDAHSTSGSGPTADSCTAAKRISNFDQSVQASNWLGTIRLNENFATDPSIRGNQRIRITLDADGYMSAPWLAQRTNPIRHLDEYVMQLSD
jgi:hypothetical protein